MPAELRADGLELKFNPSHDPADGRFTFAGAGHRYGAFTTDMPKSARIKALKLLKKMNVTNINVKVVRP